MKKKDNFLNNLATYTKKGFEDGLVIGCTTPFISFLVYGIFQDMTVNEAVKLSGIFFGSTTVKVEIQ